MVHANEKSRNFRHAVFRCLIDAIKSLSPFLRTVCCWLFFWAYFHHVMQDIHQLLQSHLYRSQSRKEREFPENSSKSFREDSYWPALGHVFICEPIMVPGRWVLWLARHSSQVPLPGHVERLPHLSHRGKGGLNGEM